MGREWRVSASSGLPRWGLPSERGLLPFPRSSPLFPSTFPQFPQSFPQGVGKLWKAGIKVVKECGNAEKSAEKSRETAVESGFRQVVENSVENVENSGFCALHTGFPQVLSGKFSGVENGCRRLARQRAKPCQIDRKFRSFQQVVPRFQTVLLPVFRQGSRKKSRKTHL